MAETARRHRWPYLLLALYLVALGASHLVRRSGEAERQTSSRTGELPTVEVGSAPPAGDRSPSPVPMAYREWPAGGPGSVTPWLLLHGSPGSSGDFRRLGSLLAADRRVLAPDLPGFGQSRRPIEDYSIRAHAAYVDDFLERLGVERVHVVGFSMGGGVAIELASLAPDRLASLTLLASIGAQEYELFGRYELNHAVHAVQLAVCWLLSEAVPHFGALDGAFFGLPYARNFYDTDQRPLRAELEAFEGPVFILHGERDPLVPVAAAREHARISPQSELVVLATDHFTVFREPDLLAPPLRDFARRVDGGLARVRATATAERLARAELAFDPATVPPASGVTLVVWFLLLAAATLVSEDLTAISAGLLVAQGRIGFVAAAAACFAGILIGDVLLFWAGRLLGRPWTRRAPFRWFLTEERIEASSAWLRRRGAAVIFASRFMPGLRLPTYFAAGVLRTGFLRFLTYFAAAVAVWTPLLVGLSSWLGEGAFALVERFRLSAPVALLGIAVLLWLGLRLARALVTWEGRRRLGGAVRRWTKWEFWPPWLVYPPVVLWILWLAVRYRSPTLFTAANPAIPAGGFVGESKADILDLLPSGAAARYRRLPLALPLAARRQRVAEVLEQAGGDFPVVLKPDVGERGRGVRVARSWEEIDAALAAANGDLLVQEYVPGPELGVFYVRQPGAKRGRILSITDKRFPEVVGDGRSPLRRLVLADGRAASLADVYLRRLGAEADTVLPAGERRRLIEVGTHCLGAIFLDGAALQTEELARAVDRIGRATEGFFFGRFDLRAASESDLRAGRGLRVLELNGVTSEATHIYDPAVGFLAAYRALFRQWSLAFEIGAANRARSAAPASLGDLLRAVGSRFTAAGVGSDDGRRPSTARDPSGVGEGLIEAAAPVHGAARRRRNG